jgi:hypothetical protein
MIIRNPNFIERKLEGTKIFHADELCTLGCDCDDDEDDSGEHKFLPASNLSGMNQCFN